MKNTRILAAAILAAFASSAQAEVTGSLGSSYTEISGADLFVANATLGYRFALNERFSFQPEIRGGTRLNEDSVGGVDVKINNTFGFNARFQADFENGFYLFAQPTYTRFEIEADAFGFSASDKDWEFGGGGGLGVMFNDHVGLEAGYERIDEADIWRGAVRFYF